MTYRITTAVMSWSEKAQKLISSGSSRWHAIRPAPNGNGLPARTFCGRRVDLTKSAAHTTETEVSRAITCNKCRNLALGASS